jgi:hypothetical protein
MNTHPQTWNTLPYCDACQSYHRPDNAGCSALRGQAALVPDDQISVCELHPERTRIARRLLAFLEDE